MATWRISKDIAVNEKDKIEKQKKSKGSSRQHLKSNIFQNYNPSINQILPEV